MTRQDRRNLDRELEGLRLEAVVAEVEVPDARVPVQGVDDVAGALVTYLAMGDIKQSQREAAKYEFGELAARGVSQCAARNVYTCQVLHIAQFLHDWVDVVVEVDGAHQVQIGDLVGRPVDQAGQRPAERLAHVVV